MMRNGTILAILTCASALSIVTEIPCAHAQEYVTYLYYQPGSGGNRINHTGTPARFVTLAGPTQESVMLTPGAIVPVPTGAPSTWTVGSIKYGLAYVNVTGGAGGGISIFPDANGNFPQAVNVPLPASSNPRINIDAYYFLISSGGPGGPGCHVNCPSGASIGEFSDTSGMLLWDPFVNVFIPPSNTANASLTNTGNMDGTVNTTNNTVRINAYPTTVTGGTFDKWVTGPGGTTGSSNHSDLDAATGSSPYALALYHSGCPTGFYWNSTSTISQCSENPVCGSGKQWDSATGTCVAASGGCPRSCSSGCYPPTYNQMTGQQVWVCKPSTKY